PPLRDRMDDLPILVDHFLRKHFRARPGSQRAQRSQPPRFTAEAMQSLSRYPWPGNIRELENEIERCMVLGGDLDEMPEDLLSQRVRDAGGAGGRAPTRAQQGYEALGSLKNAVEQLERDLIYQGLIRTHWNKSQLAKELGISRSNLITKVDRYGLDKKTV
ncbi:MAG TPA: helix-turn-helix domain-containing protein, partial [Polyangia bacterium]